MADLDVPIALRRARRKTGLVKQEEPESDACHAPPPKTPRRARKAVRFSDPGVPRASASSPPSSGLTPMVRRTSIGTPRHQRRASTPAASATQGSHHLPAGSALRRTFDGRVERRLRRDNVRHLLNKAEQEKRHRASVARSQIDHLRSEIKLRDREIHQLQNATVAIDTERMWDLEQQVDDLKRELAKRPGTPKDDSRTFDWTLAARDPFDEYTDMMEGVDDDDDDDDGHGDGDDDDGGFGDATMAQLVASTPTRLTSSFPTPPATSPLLPTTPCSRRSLSFARPSHAGVQVCFPDAHKQEMQEELASLQLEVAKLTATLDSYRNLGSKLERQLASVGTPTPAPTPAPTPLGSDTPMAHVLQAKVAALLRDVSDGTAAVARLSRQIKDLGFPGTDAGEMVTALASGFRAARLELEYLTPGEITLPLTCHGAEVLDLLLSRLRELAKKSREDDLCIDEYHDLEQSLRKQLDARVTAMDQLRAETGKAERLLHEKKLQVQQLEVGNARLKGAVDGYTRDIGELERLVERMEQEHAEATAAQAECTRQQVLEREADVAALRERLADAVRQTGRLQEEISDVQDSSTRHVVALNKRHGSALALRDARVLELRGEMDRLNDALRSAHEVICELRAERGGLQAQMDRDRAKAAAVVEAMRAELRRVLQMGHDFARSCRGEGEGEEEEEEERADPCGDGIAGRRPEGDDDGGGGDGGDGDGDGDGGDGGDDDGGDGEDAGGDGGEGGTGEVQAAARDAGGDRKLRRGYDSGLGLLPEEDGAPHP